MTMFRPASLDDVEAYLRLRHEVFPYRLNTVEGMRYLWSTTTPEERMAMFAAESGGELVGFARGSLNTWTSEAGAASVLLLVHPRARGRGIGTRLLEQVEAHLREVGGLRAQGFSTADDASMAWAARRGFEAGHEVRYSAVAVDSLPPAPDCPADVRVTTFAQAGPQAVFDVDSVATLDEPGDVPTDVIAYDEWHRHVWQAPELDLQASVIAYVDGEPAAVTLLQVDPSTGRAWSGGTGTLPAYRGRGLAKLIKSISLRRAAASGVTMAYTGNDEVNAPMLAVNEWLGYRQVAAERAQLKKLS